MPKVALRLCGCNLNISIVVLRQCRLEAVLFLVSVMFLEANDSLRSLPMFMSLAWSRPRMLRASTVVFSRNSSTKVRARAFLLLGVKATE